MEILAKNGITVPKKYITDNIYKQIKKDLIVFNPAYLSCVEYGKKPIQKTPSGKYVQIPKLLTFFKEYGDRLELPRGYSYRLSEIFDEEIELEYPYCENIRHLIDNKLNADLYDYQSEGINALLNKQCGILCSPAASGKTVIGISLIAKLGLKALWLVTLDKLAKQAVDSITKFTNCSEEHIGLISQGKYNVGNVFTSAIVNTARKYKKQLAKENFGVIVVDECHHTPTKTIYDILMSLSPQYLYGLSATPYRADGLDNIMKYMIGPITEIKREDVVNVDKIITPRVEIIDTGLFINAPLCSSYSDFISEIINNNHRNNIIIYETIMQAINNNVCLLLSERVQHCQILYDKILKIYPYVEIVSGKTKKKETEKIIKKVEQQKINILISTYPFLSEGVDIKILNRVFFTTPFRAETKVEQAVGRVQRVFTKNKIAKVYDFVDKNKLTKGQLDARLGVYDRLGCDISFRISEI